MVSLQIWQEPPFPSGTRVDRVIVLHMAFNQGRRPTNLRLGLDFDEVASGGNQELFGNEIPCRGDFF